MKKRFKDFDGEKFMKECKGKHYSDFNFLCDPAKPFRESVEALKAKYPWVEEDYRVYLEQCKKLRGDELVDLVVNWRRYMDYLSSQNIKE